LEEEGCVGEKEEGDITRRKTHTLTQTKKIYASLCVSVGG
jgi:hypothetical protein